MKYKIKLTGRFKKDYKRIKRRNYNISLLQDVITKLASGETLAPQYKDHALTGDYLGFRECHIAPDWLLVYAIKNDLLILTLSRTGTHSDLF